MYEEDANISKLKLVLLNFSVQITALKKTNFGLQKHFSVKKIVQVIQSKSSIYDGNPMLEKELKQLFEDSTKLIKDAEQVQEGLRSLNTILSAPSMNYLECKKPIYSRRISFQESDSRVDDIMDGHVEATESKASISVGNDAKIFCLIDSDEDEFDDTTVRAKKPRIEVEAPFNDIKCEAVDEEEPIKYGRGYKTICLTPKNLATAAQVKTEMFQPSKEEAINNEMMNHSDSLSTDRCSPSDSVSLVSLPDVTLSFSSTSQITTTTTTTTTTTVSRGTVDSAAKKRAVPADTISSAVDMSVGGFNKRGRISKEESKLIMTVVKQCKFRQIAWIRLEEMLGRPVTTLKEHYLTRINSGLTKKDTRK